MEDLEDAYNDMLIDGETNAEQLLGQHANALRQYALKSLFDDRKFDMFTNPDMAMENLSWTGEDTEAIALYKYLLMISTVSGVDDYGNESRAVLLLLLLELYYDAPIRYFDMFVIAMSNSCAPKWIHKLSPTQTENRPQDITSTRSRLSKLYDFLASRPGSTQIFEWICRDSDEKEKNTPLFKFYLRCLEKHLNSTIVLSEAIRYSSPFITGVNKAVHDAVNNYLEKVAERLHELPPGGGSLQRTESGDQLGSVSDLSETNPNSVLVFYGVSGSGKTRSIEHLLHKNWGHYLLPGNLGLTTQRSGDNLYDPRRGAYSKDSCLLWKLIENIWNVVPGMDIREAPIREWTRRLVLARHLVFNKYIEVAKGKRNLMNPACWLKFQNSCSDSDSDPFEIIFRLLLLINRGDPCLGFSITHASEILEEKPFFYCLDEAQCYLDTLVPNSDENLLKLACRDILLVSPYSFGGHDSRYVISGTSLKLEETISTIERTQRWDKSGHKGQPGPIRSKCVRFTEFPLLTNAKKLVALIKERGPLQKYKAHLHLVKKFGIPLRGRYLWSALYVNRLEAHLKLKRRLNKSVISKAAIETIDEAKNALKKRLSRLRKENHPILQELCWVVIQSDLLDRPTKFLRDRDHQMISEAFAVVETEGDSLQGTLKEYLAMDAAKEWFRKEKKDMYVEKFKEYLRFSTNDAASFGKAAEWFLALELWNCLHHSDRMAGSEGEKDREKILNFLSEASENGKEHKKSKGSRSSSHIKPSDTLKLASTHQLVEGRNIGYSHDTNRSFHSSGENPNSGSYVPIWEWMKSIRERKPDKPVASFYFPDNNCGPDIVFALEPKKGSKPQTLCVLQLKTGGVEDMGKAIGTTNLWMSYKDHHDRRQKMQEELREWDSATIIRILASTAKKHRLDYVTDLLKQEEQRGKKPQLFILCDGENTETLFGETFARLVDARPASRAQVEAKENLQATEVSGQISQAPKETSQTPKSSEETLESIIETRAQRKRRREEDTGELEKEEEDRKKSKLAVRSKGKGKAVRGRS